MLKAFQYSLSPIKEQTTLLDRHINACRFVYNLALEIKKMAWSDYQVNLSAYDLMKQLPELKEECLWLRDVNAQTLQQSISHMCDGFKQFFKGQSGYPKFKKKTNSGSFTIPQDIKLKNNKLSINKFREGIAIILHRPIKGQIKQATISRTATGKYFVSILCETGEPIPQKAKIEESTIIGIDLGIKTYIVTSDGKEYNNPKFLRKSQDKLRFVQRKYSIHKGKRTKHKLTKLHEKVTNQRKDFLHKTSTQFIRENQSIAIEDLGISNMVKNHSLAQSISDASWGMFVRMLEYKAEWYGKNILKIGRFEPSSKIHNTCGYKNIDLSLTDREWTCPNCGEVVLRDLNAAINIKNFAINNHQSVEHRHKNQEELPTLVGVMIPEAQTHYV